MNERQKDWIMKDWIIFLGVCPGRYDETLAVVRGWRVYARVNGVDKDGLTVLNGWLFGGRYDEQLTVHSCCLSYGSMRNDGYGTIFADFIEGGGLHRLPELFGKVERDNLDRDWQYILVNQPVQFFCYTKYYYILGFTLDGRIVIDTKEMYGGVDGQTEYRQANGDREYCRRLLETVRKNYAEALLPPVPKGILKLPDRL